MILLWLLHKYKIRTVRFVKQKKPKRFGQTAKWTSIASLKPKTSPSPFHTSLTATAAAAAATAITASSDSHQIHEACECFCKKIQSCCLFALRFCFITILSVVADVLEQRQWLLLPTLPRPHLRRLPHPPRLPDRPLCPRRLLAAAGAHTPSPGGG